MECDGQAKLAVPIKEEWFPEVTLEATAVLTSKWETPRALHDRQQIQIISRARDLRVSLDAPEHARPGQAIDVAVHVRNGFGRVPSQARVSLWAVDEGVLALTGYNACTNLESLATLERFDTDYDETLSRVIAPHDWFDPDGSSGCFPHRQARAPSVIPGLAQVRGSRSEPELRSRFATTPFFAGDMAVDARGEARARFTLPDNLTTFRLTAIASASLPGGQAPVAFGSKEGKVQTSLPLLLKPMMPSRLRPRDEVETVALLQNLTGISGEVELAVEVLGDGAVLGTLGQAKQVKAMAAGEELQLTHRLRAGHEGEARVRWRVRLRAGGRVVNEDAVELPVTVALEPKPHEQVTLSGRLAAGETRFLRLPLPGLAQRQQAELGVRFTASLAGEVEAAMQSLLAYPYGCSEQTSSRLIPFVVAPVRAQRLSRKPLTEQLERFSKRLREFHLSSQTGIGFWPAAKPDLFATTWTVLTLAAGRAAGLPLEETLLTDASAGLVAMMAAGPDKIPDDLAALAMFAAAEAGASVPSSWETHLASDQGRRSAFSLAMAAMARAKLHPGDPSVRQTLSELSLRLEEDATIARAAATARPSALPSQSATTAQAAVLWAFARLWPQHPVVAKLTTSLLSLRQGLAWDSTFENALALYALSALGVLRDPTAQGNISVAIEDSPLLAAGLLPSDGRPLLRTWTLGEPSAPRLPSDRDSAALTLHAGPDGAIFYTVFLSYVPADADGASNSGITVAAPLHSRFGVLGSHEPLAMGEVVAIDLSLQSEREREHVAVEIPLPAGVEPFDLELGHNASLIAPNLAALRQLDVAAEELHQDRILVFVRSLEPGLPRRYTVYARAALPGSYVLPGARAEAMYAPTVRGRAGVRALEITLPVP